MSDLLLPDVVRRYLGAKKGPGASASDFFTEDAFVHDVGEDLEWMGHTSGYDVTVKPTTATPSGPELHVGAVVSGNFPGSPYEFLYKFTLEGDKIRSLAIDPIGPLNP
jgi:hypothetical protein